ncbi:ORF6C domain-containing protein [Enterococcus faecalis]
MQRTTLKSEAKSMLFQDLGSSIKRLFNVPNRGRIKDKDFQRVLEFIDNWQPSSVTKEQIKQLELEMF